MEEEASHPTPEGDEPKIEETAEENEPEVGQENGESANKLTHEVRCPQKNR